MLAIIIVNYHNEELTISYVQKELSKISIEHKIIVVNNDANKQNSQRLQSSLSSECIIINNPQNLGFAKANNIGADYAINHFFSDDLEDDWLLITNNDIQLHSPTVVEELINKLKEHPEAGIIGPKIIGLDGKKQGPYPYYSIAEKYILPFWGKLFINRSELKKRLKYDFAETAIEGPYYRLMGAFFIARATDWKAINGFDSSTFLYAEEEILSERLKKIGKVVYYYPFVSIIHQHGSTTKRFYSEIQLRHLCFKSEAYYYKHYIGTSSIQLFAARMTLFLKDIKDIICHLFAFKR